MVEETGLGKRGGYPIVEVVGNYEILRTGSEDNPRYTVYDQDLDMHYPSNLRSLQDAIDYAEERVEGPRLESEYTATLRPRKKRERHYEVGSVEPRYGNWMYLGGEGDLEVWMSPAGRLQIISASTEKPLTAATSWDKMERIFEKRGVVSHQRPLPMDITSEASIEPLPVGRVDPTTGEKVGPREAEMGAKYKELRMPGKDVPGWRKARMEEEARRRDILRTGEEYLRETAPISTVFDWESEEPRPRKRRR